MGDTLTPAGYLPLCVAPANFSDIAIHSVIGTQKLMRKSRGHFVFLHSARGLAHSKTLRVFHESLCRAQRLGLSTLRSTATEDGRRPSAAFPNDILNCANVTWNCYRRGNKKFGDLYNSATPCAPNLLYFGPAGSKFEKL